MVVWVLSQDNGEGGVWETIYGSRKECLDEVRRWPDNFGKRFKNDTELLRSITHRGTGERRDYAITKMEDFYTGA